LVDTSGDSRWRGDAQFAQVRGTMGATRQSENWRDERGQVLVLVTMSLMVLLTFVGLVLDMGIALEHRRQLQNAVDAAALAGAQMLPDTTAAATQADLYFDLNAPTMGTPSLTIEFPPGESGQIRIEGSSEYRYVFLSLFGPDTTTVSASALAGAQVSDVMIALDRSGSMCQDSHGLRLNCPNPPPDHEPMTAVKTAANEFAALFPTGASHLGLVSFATTASLDQGLTVDFGPGSGLEAAVNSIVPSGRTNIGDALKDARTELMHGAGARPNALKVIVLLSDGVPNRCANGSSCTSNAAANYARAQAQAARARDITIYTVGLGNNLDLALMQDLADIGNGLFIQSPTPAELQATFEEIADDINVRILQ
jgi:von Willebrand factor type A domain/Putative Flp pilus-assembly TadE/G-like